MSTSNHNLPFKIGIVADDLTGAADSAAPFAGTGRNCGVFLGDNELNIFGFSDYDVVSISTETRELSESSMINSCRVAYSTRALMEQYNPDLLIKKVDSMLRGNSGAESMVMHSRCPERFILICPAFPDQGRQVRMGNLYVAGVNRGSIVDMFGGNANKSVRLVSIDDLHSPQSTIELFNINESHQHYLIDAETNEDLQSIAELILATPRKWLPVCSAGLTSALASRMANAHSSPMIPIASKLLVIIGSQTTGSHRQVKNLLEQYGIVSCKTVDGARRSLTGAHKIALVCAPKEPAEDREVVLQNLFTGAESMIRDFATEKSAVILISGGATARALMAIIGASQLEIIGQLVPGIVVANARICLETFNLALPMILKSGSFGDDNLLVEIARGLLGGNV